ncbi:MAG TPA: diacylglycerol kinase family protein, partial [Bacteroidota bacterium]|nr:diacylglycerol kinase family protein [Bacteroidota bacterium]
IQPHLAAVIGSFYVIEAGPNAAASLLHSIRRGERDFVAAGGDGTLNYLLNILVSELTAASLSEVRIGAIGIGSSNDFHKPFDSHTLIGGFPCRLNFGNARLRDIGIVRWTELGTEDEKQRCWINNASTGVTAEANYFFNHPDRLLFSMKKRSTNLAIVFAALRTIAAYETVWGEFSCSYARSRRAGITNLGIVKNPHFSGSLCYDTDYPKEDGTFYVHLCEAMSKCRTLAILYGLSHRKFRGNPRTQSFLSNEVRFYSPDPFAVEYDGETTITRRVEFSLRKNAVLLCA